MITFGKILYAMFLLLFSLVATAANEKQVGEVVFSIGNASLSSDGQAFTPATKGYAVLAGQTIKTESNGHVHIRFIDNAFVSIRPNSILQIEDYLTDSNNPKNNRIKFTLKQGTSRLITGKAGQANKDSFRLNTPIAAIGIRGTDFVVQTDQSVSRVSVLQGGISIAPIGGDCLSSGLGSCKGDMVRELSGSLSGNYLELKGLQPAELMTPQTGKQPFALPRPEEPALMRKSENTGGLSNLGSNNNFMWGRWAGSTATPTGYELIGQNEAFALFRLSEQQVLPSTGAKVQFELGDVVAYGRYDGGNFLPATVSNAKFAVNFEDREFSTRFNWVFDGNSRQLFSRGSISEDGRLIENASKSNMSFSGALGDNGQSAAYIFSKRFNSEELRAYGILHWSR